MVKLSVAITHHPARAAHIPYTVESLRPLDPFIATDTEHAGSRATSMRCWRSYDPTADYHLVVEDDCYFADDFIPGAIAALTALTDARGYQPVCFFANRQVCEEAFLRGDSWVRIPDGSWGQAICWPTKMLPGFFDWYERAISPSAPPKHADTPFTLYLLLSGLASWCTVPSLIDHEGAASSLLGHSNKKRVARVFSSGSALAHDWTRGLDNPLTGGSATPREWFTMMLRPEYTKKRIEVSL